MVRIAGVVGSLREHSYNHALMREATNLLPSASELDIVEIRGLPFFNEDLEGPQGIPPAAVCGFKDQVAAADALLIATPEYNWSVPGVLKNALDWLSRPPAPAKGKPAAIMGATTGSFGTVRAQLHLRQILAYDDMRVLSHPQVLVVKARDRFEHGRLTDEVSLSRLAALLKSLVDLSLEMRASERIAQR